MKYLTLKGSAIRTVAGLLAMAFVACSKQPMEQSSVARNTETQSSVARNTETQSPSVKPFTSSLVKN